MSSYSSISTSALISQMEHAGRVPEVALIMALFERRAEAEPLVLDLFRDSYDDDWPDDDPRWYRFVHAGRLLIAWGVEAALPTFADLYLDDDLQDTLEWFGDAPAYFGPPAIPLFLRVLSTPTAGEWHYGRTEATAILAKIARLHPETRDEIVAAMRALLPTVADIRRLTADMIDETWLWIVYALSELQDESTRAQALALIDIDDHNIVLFDREEYEARMRGEDQDDLSPVYDLAGEYQRLVEMARREKEWENDRQKRPQARPVEKVAPATKPAPVTKPAPATKIGRNDPCPCGSGKKYKHCHGRPGQ